MNEDNNDARALQLYKLALSSVETRGDSVISGLTKMKECRAGSLLVRYEPALGSLEVWTVGKVLRVKRHNATLQVMRYRPGDWEEELEVNAEEMG